MTKSNCIFNIDSKQQNLKLTARNEYFLKVHQNQNQYKLFDWSSKFWVIFITFVGFQI